MENWVHFADIYIEKDCISSLKYLDECLNNRDFLVNNEFSKADEKVYQALMMNDDFKKLLNENKLSKNVFRYIQNLNTMNISIHTINKTVKPVKKNDETSHVLKDNVKFEEGGKYVELKGAIDGKVVVRFPPEASGYLHIGHAKAAFINYHYKNVYNGKLILRFDDTNPDKDSGDFQNIILEDLQKMGIKYDSLSYTSDYFDLMLNLCENLIQEGNAYVDYTDPEEMKKEREKCVESKCRNHSIEENLRLWIEMKKGSDEGLKCCVRAKFDMNSKNGCMRDPTIYRCKSEKHVRTGDKYKVYPTYDFACPIVDSIENVTHSLRTSEYNDRNEQFYKFIDMLKLRKPEISDYSRMNLQNTLLSKRKLTWIVNEGYVDGWDDPRMPTVRGILRHGMTMEGLQQFIIAQGFGRNIATMSWDKLWAFNKKVIDPKVPRYTAINASKSDQVKVIIEDQNKIEIIQTPKHPKDPSVGIKTTYLSKELLIEYVDAEMFELNKNVTFINWGNMLVKSINSNNGKINEIICRKNIEDKNFKNTLKVTWLPVVQQDFIPISALYYDNLITKNVLDKEDNFKDFINKKSKRECYMIGDFELSTLKKGEIIQLQRKGYFICDQEYKNGETKYPLVLINVPEGKMNEADSKSNESQSKSKKTSSVQSNENKKLKKETKESKKEIKESKKESKKDNKLNKDKELNNNEVISNNIKENIKKSEDKSKDNDNAQKKQTRVGIEVKKEEDLAEWYKQVLTKSKMLSYYNVSGCYIIREWGYFIWEEIVNYFNSKIRLMGIHNCAFPMFVTEDCLKKEKDHIADFSPEVAWVTRSGDKDMEKPIAIRPTSETVMYPYFADWIQSYEDLPFRINQWCNVVRWEFKQPTPFLRSREFYWQEGHTVHETKAGAEEEVFEILEHYAGVYEELLAIPVVRGRKTDKEKFAGADFTTTVEAYISAAGRGIQGATSHHLGQNFSKMFEVKFNSRDGTNEYGWQNSWGLTTRTLGVLVMVHGDNKGLVLPPKVAQIQVVIVPVGITAKTTQEEKCNLLDKCNSLQKYLMKDCQIRTHFDDNESRTPGWKFNHWELLGVPIRLEIGPNEMKTKTVVISYRYNGTKETISMDGLENILKEKMVEIHKNMYNKALIDMESHRSVAFDMETLCAALERKELITAPFCGDNKCEAAIRSLSEKKSKPVKQQSSGDGAGGEILEAPSMGAKSLCIPFESPKGYELGNKCVQCDMVPKFFCMFGRSY